MRTLGTCSVSYSVQRTRTQGETGWGGVGVVGGGQRVHSKRTIQLQYARANHKWKMCL